jgi:CHAT domain-containing protein/Tfp pilus assembly protein PilF
MSGFGQHASRHRDGQRHDKAIAFGLFFLILTCGLACSRRISPQAAFEHARLTFQHGDLIQSQQEAEEGYRRFSHSSPGWASKFRVLEAESLLWRGRYPEVLALLASEGPNPALPEITVSILTLRGIAHARQLDLATATQELQEAERLCTPPQAISCGEALQGHGLFALGQNQFPEAQRYFEQALSFATARNDRFLEMTSLLNLTEVLLKEARFDEAIDRSRAAYEASMTLGAADIALAAQENLGWAHYRLGDSEGALGLLIESERRAEQLGDPFAQENALTNIGYIYMDARSFGLAEQSFQRSFALAKAENSKEHMYNTLRVLARLAVQTGDLVNAGQYAQRALEIAWQSGNHTDELYPMLVEGQIEARQGKPAAAENRFHGIEQDKGCPKFLKWEAEHSLARIYEEENRPAPADRAYQAALATFEGARDTVRHEDFQLSFLTNASHIYDDYVHFLVAQGRPDEALRWADFNRARTLAEGLGLLAKRSATGPPLLNPGQIARQANGVILFYWLGEKQSYLWAITRQKSSLFTLPPGAEIDAAVARYRESLAGPQDVLASADRDGQSLYRTLVAPAQALLKKDAKVFIIPDGSLNNLNFETLLVPEAKPSEAKPPAAKPSEAKPPEPKLHYWIEDVTITNASSLRVLAAARPNKEKRGRTLLLVGNSVAPNDKYPQLPRAEDQMNSVARRFPAAEEKILTQQAATPPAYLASNPERFSYIHFVAHGMASRLSPLDSAIVLSKSSAEDDSFKLYARDIIGHPLRAELVTISACYSSGERAYSGEGLVGLSWAFLRAGAHNVIAALWEATDNSTEQLMDKFYDELQKGKTPDAALRDAKLSLLHNSAFHNPHYWAPFQLYARLG